MPALALAVEPPARPWWLERYPEAEHDGNLWRDGEYWLDERAADNAVRFFAEHLRLTEGEFAGRPFKLAAWQEEIVRNLFGWKRANGVRRYRRAFIWVPRKNGKTEWAAGLSLIMLLGDGEARGQVYSIAVEKDQAALVHDKAAAMVAYSPSLSARLECYKHSIYCPGLGASFKPLSGKPQGKHGLSMSGLIGDEVHEWKSGDLYTFVHDSGAARRQPLEVMISTAGVKGTHGEQIWRESEAIANGDIDDPSTMVRIFGAAAEDDWTSPEVWAKANPNLGVSVKLDTLAEDCSRAQQSPRLENDFKRYRLNMWTEQAVRWLPLDGVDDEGRRFGWDHCAGPIPWDKLAATLAGKRCFGGLDLSAVQDLSALVWWFPVQEGLLVPVMLPRFFKPRAFLKVHGRRDRVDYEGFAKTGALFDTPGNVVDYEFIRAQIYRDGEMFNIAYAGARPQDVPEGCGSIGIDRWNAIETTVKLREQGLNAALFGQGFASLSAPAKELERLVLDNAFHHGGHPLLRQHAKAVAIDTDAAGNIKPSKEGSSQRIDGIAGGVTAIGVAAKDAETGGGTLDSYLASLIGQ